MDLRSLLDREFAVPYAVAGWTAAVILGLTVLLQRVSPAVGGNESALWFRVGGGWIALLMAALAWIVVSEPIRLERRVEEATREVRRSEARYRLLYDQAPVAYLTLDEDGTIRGVNDRFEEQLGYARPEIEGSSLGDLFGRDAEGQKQAQDLLDRFHRDERVRGEELPALTGDGEARWIRFTMRHARDPRDDAPPILATAVDVTDRKEAETQLEYYARQLEQSNEDLQRFASVVSHDLQEPIRVVKGYLDLLARRHGEAIPEDAQEYVELAADGTERMQTLIESLLKYSRVDTGGQPDDPVDLDEVIDNVADDLSLTHDDERASIEVGSLPTVRGDETLLRRLFQNLVSNALDHAGPGARVRVEAEPDQDWWTIRVDDDGPGIPEDQLDEVFEIFHRVDGDPDETGSGIGLAICRRIAESHGGRIEASPSPLGGARFEVKLPDLAVSRPTSPAASPGVSGAQQVPGEGYA